MEDADPKLEPAEPERGPAWGNVELRTGFAVSLTAHAGINRITYHGLSLDTVVSNGTRLLMPGRYTVVVTATNAAGRLSKPRTLTFTIVS